jgi:ribose 5-phosphate isomerase A
MQPAKDPLYEYKKMAADYAVQFVMPGMVVGLGHGSTAILAVQKIGELLKEGNLKGIIGIPCSIAIQDEAEKLGIPLGTLDEHPIVDVTIDGADEVDEDLNLIKGGGGALLREKLVAKASKREIIIVDESKLSSQLGTKYALPIEVSPAMWQEQVEFIQSLGGKPTLRGLQDGEAFHTDSGNYILDCDFGPIDDPPDLAKVLQQRDGIVEHGLFLGLVTDLIVAGPNGIEHSQALRSDGRH